jgi:hypothetical protein
MFFIPPDSPFLCADQAGWTPASAAANLAAWVDFGADFAAFQSTSSGAFVNVSDIAGGGATLTAPTSGQRPAVESTTTLQGHGGAHFTSGADSRLYTTSGGVTGRGAHTFYVVASLDSLLGTDPACGIMGQTDPGFAGKCSTVGASSPHWWGSRSGGSVVVGGAADTLPHLFQKVYDGTNVSLYVDDILVAGPTSDTGYALQNGFGFTPWNASFLSSYRTYAAVWRSGADNAATSGLHTGYFANRFGLFLAIVDGDSMTAGYLIGIANSWATLVSEAGGLVKVAGFSQPNIAVTGRTLATCLANQPTAVNTNVSASGAIPSIVSIWAGVNDLNAADNSAAATYANLGTYVSNCHTAGQKVIVWTIPAGNAATSGGGVASWYPAQRSALNTLILANSIGADGVVTAPALDSRLQTPGDGIYIITGNSPHYTALGQSICAAEAATLYQLLAGPLS